MTVPMMMVSAMTGAAVQEILQWYSLRRVLSKAEHRSVISDPIYWAVTIAMVLGCSLFVVFWMYGREGAYSPRDALLIGVAFPAFVRKSVAGLSGPEERAQGVRWTTYLS